SGRGLEFRVTSDERKLKNNRIPGDNLNHLSEHFRKFQTAGGEPCQLALVSPGFEVVKDGKNGHGLLDLGNVCCARQRIAAGTVGRTTGELQEFVQLTVGQAVTDIPSLIIRHLTPQLFLLLLCLSLRRALGCHGSSKG